MSVTLEVARTISELEYADLGEEVQTAAKVSLADALAVMLAATRLEPATSAFADHALAFGGTPEASLLGSGGKVPAPLAAFANGALAHAIDFEDTFDATGVHPHAAVVPAALALAERDGASGKDTLLALAIGGDFVCRLSLALQTSPAKRGWYHPPMLGALGAALASARLLRLDPGQIVDALSLAACQFSLSDELVRSPDSHLRAIRDGFAARAGLEAALLASHGVKGVAKPLEGDSGVFAMLTGAPPDLTPLLHELGNIFHGPEVAIKRWPSCRGTHAPIAAALALRKDGLIPGAVSEVIFDVAKPDDMLLTPLEQRQRPKTAIDAKFSIPFSFAAALVQGKVDLATFDGENLADEEIRVLAGRVSLGSVVDSDKTELRIATRDGVVHQRMLKLRQVDRAGSIPIADLRVKMESCLEYAAVAVRTEALLRNCLSLQKADAISPMQLFHGTFE